MFGLGQTLFISLLQRQGLLKLQSNSPRDSASKAVLEPETWRETCSKPNGADSADSYWFLPGMLTRTSVSTKNPKGQKVLICQRIQMCDFSDKA